MKKIHELFWFAIWRIGRLINRIRNAYYTGKFEYNFKMNYKKVKL